MSHSQQIKNISGNIFQLMQQHGVKNVRELARLIGCPATSIYNLTRMTNKNPTIETLRPIAQFFDVTIDALIDDNLLQTTAMQQKGTCTLVSLTDLEQGKLHSNVHEIYHGDASDQVIAVQLTRAVYPYKVQDILYFDKLAFDLIAFPSLCIVQSGEHRQVETLYLIDQEIYLKKHKSFPVKKEVFELITDVYEQPVIEYSLISVKLHHGY